MDAWRKAHGIEPGSVLRGAQTILLPGGPRAALVLHGFGDTPESVAPLASALHRHGWTVLAPLLPGHGCTLEEFSRSRARDWVARASEAYRELSTRHASLALVGVSMGGALAAHLTRSPGVRKPGAVVLLAPYLAVPPRAWLWTSLWPVWRLWRPWIEGDAGASIFEPSARARSLGYGCATPRLLRELRRVVELGRRALPTLDAPTLAIFSSQDYRIPAEAAQRTFALIGATRKELHWVVRSGHVITVDHDAPEVCERTVAWLERHVAP